MGEEIMKRGSNDDGIDSGNGNDNDCKNKGKGNEDGNNSDSICDIYPKVSEGGTRVGLKGCSERHNRIRSRGWRSGSHGWDSPSCEITDGSCRWRPPVMERTLGDLRGCRRSSCKLIWQCDGCD